MSRVYLGHGRKDNVVPSWQHRRYHVQDSFVGSNDISRDHHAIAADQGEYKYLLVAVIQVSMGSHSPFMSIGRIRLHPGIGNREVEDLSHFWMANQGMEWGSIASTKAWFADMKKGVPGYSMAWTDVGPISEYE